MCKEGHEGRIQAPWAPALPPPAGALLLSLLLQCFTTISSSVPLPLSWQSAHSWAAPGLGPGFPSRPICSVCGGWWMGWSRGHTEENLAHTTSWLYRLLSPRPRVWLAEFCPCRELSASPRLCPLQFSTLPRWEGAPGRAGHLFWAILLQKWN